MLYTSRILPKNTSSLSSLSVGLSSGLTSLLFAYPFSSSTIVAGTNT